MRGIPEGRAPRGARGLKHLVTGYGVGPTESRPARGAWIETQYMEYVTSPPVVAPRAGRVD